MARTLTLLLFNVCLCLLSFGQKEYNNWYFGKNAAIDFNSGNPVVKYDNAMSTFITASSISDRNTGELLFYTNGSSFWNKNHSYTNGTGIGAATDVIIVPYPNNSNLYYIIGSANYNSNALSYFTVDMNLDNGLRGVTNSVLITNSTGGYLVVTKHALEKTYWLITHTGKGNDNLFTSLKITDNGIDTVDIVKSKHSNFPSAQRIGETTSTSDGTIIACTYFDLKTAAVQTFTFDKICGKVGDPINLHVEPDWVQAQGICFSPDDTKLYATFSTVVRNAISKSYVVQYYGDNFSQWQIVATSSLAFNGLRLGPDNRIYISINNNKQKPSSRVDALLFPNQLGNAVGYTPKYLDLGTNRTTNYKFPTMIYDKSPFGNFKNKNNIIEKNTCLGDSTFFSLTNNQILDSVHWELEKGSPIVKTNNPFHIYSDTGIYTVTANQFYCNHSWSVSKNIKIISSPSINWPLDTMFCYNDEITLSTPFISGNFIWSTGDTAPTINVNKEGLYWVNVSFGSCQAEDSILLIERPPILINLGDNFTVCEHDTDNLVKLDAGKGYKHYKWTPTGDTTQWIIVKQAGDYYVVVEDFRGCEGEDGSRVERLCNFDFHLPNAFSPNGDGLNDVFKATASDILNFELEIFNSWGEKVFSSNNTGFGWDGTYKGKPCIEGVYLYKLCFKGYSNKLLKVFNQKGTLNLLR